MMYRQNQFRVCQMKMANFIFFIILIIDWISGQPDPKCGVRHTEGRIVGGVDTGGYHYPWFALLLLRKNSYMPVPVCAGSLITPNYVLSAAHCFTISSSTQKKDLFNVALGVYNICNEEEATREIFNVAEVAVHEMYQKRGKFYDIALIKLDRPAAYTVICLPISGVPDITEAALLIGFGVTAETSDLVPCRMLEVNITKYSKMDCLNTKLPLEDRKEPSVICAGELTGKADSCYGDSGGPLQTKTSDGRYVVAGIVSYGYGCAVPEVPGIYTNVGSYIQWIDEKISQLDSRSSDRRKNLIRPRPFSRKRTVVFKHQNATVFFPENKILVNSSQHTEKKSKPDKNLNEKVRPDVTFKDNKIRNTKHRNSSVTFPK